MSSRPNNLGQLQGLERSFFQLNCAHITFGCQSGTADRNAATQIA